MMAYLSKKLFAQYFNLLCELEDKTPSEALTKFYYEVVKHLSDAEFEEKMKQLLLTWKQNYLPKPAEFLVSNAEELERRAYVALNKLMNVIEDYGAYASVKFDDPVIHMVVQNMGGWVEVCKTEVTEWQRFKKNEFIKLYKIYSIHPVDHPDVLIGIHEIENSILGFEYKKICHIGNKPAIEGAETCKQIQQN